MISDAELAAVPVDAATDADIAAFTERALADLGLTYDELAAQAHTSSFVSEHARRLWFAIKPLAG